MGPTLPFSEKLHAEKYRGKGETFKEAMTRVANSLEDDEHHFRVFREILLSMRFMPGGRIQNAIGSTRSVTPYNCFVSGTIMDSFVDGDQSIMDIAKEAATTMRMGGGIGYDFSTLRPQGDLIRRLESHSSGPISFMQIYNAICLCTASSGHRRGAQMGVMRVDHPDIEAFVRAKQPPEAATPILEELKKYEVGTGAWLQWYAALQEMYRLTGFNLSIAVTDEFMQAVVDGKPFSLRFEGKHYRDIDARSLWNTIMRSAWDWAEPGVIFIDTINRQNNLWYCENIIATNPCGEQPLPQYGACLLGSFNLVKYLVPRRNDPYFFNWDQLKADIPHVVRAMDNVVDRATFPLPAQAKEARNKRRMGLGVTGLANTIEAMGHPYGSDGFLSLERRILWTIANGCYRASAILAKEKGTFPLYDADRYLSSTYVENTLDAETKDLIRKYGVRNSHLTSIAPTGTISLCADNVSSGIEPVFSYHQKRIVNMPQGQVETDFDDYGVRELDVRGKRCADVTIEEHLRVLAIATVMVDSSVSKTCNVPADTPWEVFKQTYVDAWRRGCKGLTTFQIGGKRAGIIQSTDDVDGSGKERVCRIDAQTGRRECE